MASAPLPDPAQQTPITADDPRVARVLALLQAKAAQAPPVDTSATPITTQIAPQAAPVLPPSAAPNMPGPQIAPQDPNAPSMTPLAPRQSAAQPQMPQVSQPNAPQVAQTPPQPSPPAGPVKSFLQHLGSHLASGVASGQAALLTSAGLPTPYEKQQNAAKLAIQQQAANDTSAYRQSVTDLTQGKSAQLDAQNAPYTFGTTSDIPAQLRGQTFPTIVATALQKALGVQQLKGQTAEDISTAKNATAIQGKQIQYGPDSYLRHGVRSVGGRIEMYDKGTGEKLQDMGQDTALITGPANANARAAANARYRTFDTTDANGAPVTISGLDALQGGAAHVPYTEAKGILSDKVGVQQYQDILDNKIAPNLAVLNDNTQRVAIAHTLSELDKNPGATQALLTSALQNGALTPAGAQLTAGIMQAREFGGVARKYGGNMNGTEGLMNRIMSNQASPLNSLQLNQDLVANDRAFTQRALGTLSTLTSHQATGRTGPANIDPQVTFTRTGKYTDGRTVGERPDGSWVFVDTGQKVQ